SSATRVLGITSALGALQTWRVAMGDRYRVTHPRQWPAAILPLSRCRFELLQCGVQRSELDARMDFIDDPIFLGFQQAIGADVVTGQHDIRLFLGRRRRDAGYPRQGAHRSNKVSSSRAA